MKSIIIILALFISLGTACKTKKSAIATTSSTTSTRASVHTGDAGTSATGNNEGINTGKISHKYHSTGCETVIIIHSEDGSEITLIPKDKLSNDVDMEGQLIRFDYKTLKMPQPAGCTVGMPAEITNITKLK
jgi:hypothetical protein